MKKRWVWLSLLSLCAACGPHPAIGDWESVDDVAGERNEMELEEDGRGEATLYFFYGEDLFRADFDLEWEEKGDNGRITVDFECDGDCSEIDFEMDCEFSSDEEEMECDGEEPFREYAFEWERR